ncbi:calcium permeable stress-gated cation channel [Microdochium nivale]|nr:calcium permeable stress-gated cation channel [Microdochium nivale]
MSDPGSAADPDKNKPISLSSLISTLVPVAVGAGVYITIFLILRKSNRRYYAPRTYIGSLRERERTPALPSGFLNWIPAFWKTPDLHALQHQSLDAYLFLRFLKVLTSICFFGACLTWPILFPINITGGGTSQQLDVLTYGNIDTSTMAGKNRFFAHALVSWLFYGFVLYMILRENIYYVNLRQAFLLSPFYANRISSRTVLFVSVPDDYLDERRLRKVFGESVQRVWITGDSTNVDELVEERDKVAMTLEKAEVKLIQLANAERLKAAKKGGDAGNRGNTELDAEPGSMAARWIPQKKRPTHRLGPLGLFGKKVDTIEWSRSELHRLVPETAAAQDKYRSGDYKKINSVFIEFATQADAESAFQVLAHHQALQMSPKYIGVTPGEIVWSALKVSWWQRVIRRFAVVAFITVLIIFWAIPVGFVGAISNVTSLIEFLPWLGFINNMPPALLGVITGLLPSVALAILMSLVPIIMRLCAKLSGEPSLSRVELFTQNAYFCFQVVQVFLITTMASAAPTIIKGIIDEPASITGILANNIPKASNFYLPYFIVQGMGVAASVLSQVVGFAIFTLVYKFLAKTPRAMYKKWSTLSAISWGSLLPVYTNIAVISLVYATIAPLVLGFGTIGIGLFWLAWRYNVLFVTDTTIDTRGLIYPRALKQLLVGVYIAEICMVGLFAASAAFGPMVLMIAFLVFTALFHITMNNAMAPLLANLPRTLEAEENTLRAALTGHNGDGHSNGNEKAVPEHTEAAQKKPSFIAKWLKPWNFQDYHTLRRLVPTDGIDVNNLYTEEIERNAYHPPAVSSVAPLLWIPEDSMGISKQEIRDTEKVIPITDEGCTLNEKNKLEWDTESVRPPIWDEKIYY